MNPKTTDIIIIIVLGVPYIVFFVLYLLPGNDWARLPFFLLLTLISLYNLFFNRRKQDE